MPITNKDGNNSTKGHVVSPSQTGGQGQRSSEPKNVHGATANDGGRGGKNKSSNEKKKGAESRQKPSD